LITVSDITILLKYLMM